MLYGSRGEALDIIICCAHFFFCLLSGGDFLLALDGSVQFDNNLFKFNFNMGAADNDL